jgi:hypothetical protein
MIILPIIIILKLDNPDFKEYLITYLINNSARIIIITDTNFKAAEINKQLLSICNKI